MEPGSMPVIVIILLLLISAFLSMAETALTTLSRTKIRAMVDEGVKGAEVLDRLINRENFLTAILIGNNFVNIFVSTLTATIVNGVIGDRAGMLATTLTTLGITLVILIFGEITPKAIGSRFAEQVCLFVTGPVNALTVILTPFSWLLSQLSKFIISRVEVNRESTPTITQSELKSMVDAGQEEGVFDIREQELIHNVLSFDASDAEDIMTPRTDIIALPVDAPYEEFLRVFREERFSRVPIYENDMDHITGVVHFKDFFLAGPEFSAADHIREPFFSYESKDALGLFTEMRSQNVSFAVILDEYGGTAGIVTLEDLLELLVGEIYDEHDETENEIEQNGENSFLVEGGANLQDFNDAAGTNLSSEDYETVGGYVMGLLGRIPSEGDIVTSDGICFHVKKTDKNRVEKVLVTIEKEDEESDV